MRRSAAKLFGLALSVACLAYFGIEAHKILSGTTISWVDSAVLRALPVAAIPYFIAYAVLAIAWHFLLRSFGLTPALPCSVGIYLTTQIAKYLPGNVGHHVGRIYLSSTHGLPSVRVGMSMIVEVALVVAAAVLLSLPLAPLVIERLALSQAGWMPSLAIVLGLVASTVLGAYLLERYRLLAPIKAYVLDALREVRSAGSGRFLVVAAVLIFAGMVLVGCSLVALTISTVPSITLPAVTRSVAVFSAAWIAGFLAPGAPAGLGVREAILLAGLSPSLGRESAVEVTIFFRALSVGADLVALFAGSLLLRLASSRAARE